MVKLIHNLKKSLKFKSFLTTNFNFTIIVKALLIPSKRLTLRLVGK